MRLVITDTGTVWNYENPFLNQFQEIVVVVCLNGKEVTDKYVLGVEPEVFDYIYYQETNIKGYRECPDM